jgi:hypothetical protein
MSPPCVEDRKEDGDEEGAAGPLKRESTSAPAGGVESQLAPGWRNWQTLGT